MTYINSIKTIKDFNHINIEIFSASPIYKKYKFNNNDIIKIENIIKDAYSFDGDVSINLIQSAIHKILGSIKLNIIKTYQNYKGINEFLTNPVTIYSIYDNENNLLFTINIYTFIMCNIKNILA